MSYGEQTRNQYEHDESPIDDETRFPCPCGDPRCVGYNDDIANIKVGPTFYAADCETGRRLDQIADGRERESKQDVVRDDDFEQVRR